MTFRKVFLFSLLLLSISISGCKKEHPAETREVFTSDQLGWIINKINPKYRCVTKTTNLQGNIITSIDTIDSEAGGGYYQTNGTDDYDQYVINYYTGGFSFKLAYIIAGIDSVYYNLYLEINNRNNFQARLIDYPNFYYLTQFQTDTATIDGVIYHDVYKIYEGAYLPQSITKVYFKKGIGYLYLEQANGNNATLIQ